MCFGQYLFFFWWRSAVETDVHKKHCNVWVLFQFKFSTYNVRHFNLKSTAIPDKGLNMACVPPLSASANRSHMIKMTLLECLPSSWECALSAKKVWRREKINTKYCNRVQSTLPLQHSSLLFERCTWNDGPYSRPNETKLKGASVRSNNQLFKAAPSGFNLLPVCVLLSMVGIVG